MIEFILNDKLVIAVSPPTTVLLDFIRREQKLIGTKEGCREGDCGACSILLGELKGNDLKYKTVNSCLTPLHDVHGKHVVTIEGLNNAGLSSIQKAFVEKGGAQCGFCTPGFIVSLTGYFLNAVSINYEDAVDYLSGNICRCTGYNGIKRAVEESVALLKTIDPPVKNIRKELIANNFLPSYFLEIPNRLKKISPAVPQSPRKGALIAGGTDLYVQRWDSLVKSEGKFISGNQKFGGIAREGGRFIIGAAATIEEIRNSAAIQKFIPGWKDYLKLFGSLQVRSRATVGGNIVNASPIADMANILVALNAGVHLAGGKKKRNVYLKDFYKGYKTLDKKEDEIIEAVSFTLPKKQFLFNYEKISKREYLDIASVNSACLIETKGSKILQAGISAGGVAPVPLYLKGMCGCLTGKEISTELILEAVKTALEEISPISDARGSAEYKKLLLRQLLYTHFIKLFPDKTDIERLI